MSPSVFNQQTAVIPRTSEDAIYLVARNTEKERAKWKLLVIDQMVPLLGESEVYLS